MFRHTIKYQQNSFVIWKGKKGILHRLVHIKSIQITNVVEMGVNLKFYKSRNTNV